MRNMFRPKIIHGRMGVTHVSSKTYCDLDVYTNICTLRKSIVTCKECIRLIAIEDRDTLVALLLNENS